MITDIVRKIARGLNEAELNELLLFFAKMERMRGIENVTALDNITWDLGEVFAGRFIAPADPNNNDVSDPAFSGTYMDTDGVTGKNAGTTQVQLSSADGKIKAAAGIVVLDANGIEISAKAATANDAAYKFTKSGSVKSGMFAAVSATENNVSVQTNTSAGLNSNSVLRSDAASDKIARSDLLAYYGGSSQALVRAEASSTGSDIDLVADDVDITADSIALTGSVSINGAIEASTHNGNTYVAPTLTNITNVAASTAHVMHVIRIDNTVFVAAQITVDPTATGTVRLGMTLPVSSDFTDTTDLSGTASGVYGHGGVIADTANNRADIYIDAQSAASNLYFVTFSYEIK